MNLETRKLVRVPNKMIGAFGASEIRSIVRQPKVQPVDEENQIEQLFRVRYLDIDSNQHVNNSKYFDWIINTLDFDFLKIYKVKRVQIKYEKEVEYGNIITSRMSITEKVGEDGTIMTAHQIMNEGTVACTANLFWITRN